MRMPKIIPTDQLDAGFVALMARAGMPTARPKIDAQRGRGPAPRVLNLPDGRTVRLRTNQKPAVMSLAASGEADAELPFETEDFLGAAFPTPDGIAGYMVPSVRAAGDIKANHEAWLAESPTHARDNKTRLIYFDGDQTRIGHGYADKWHEFSLGVINLHEIARGGEPQPASLSRFDRARRELIEAAAEEFSVPVARIQLRLGIVGASSELILPL